MKILFVGDIFGSSGRDIVKALLPKIKDRFAIDITIANGENMAGGFGVTPNSYQEVMQAGIDIMTGGNHSFDKKEAYPLLQDEPYLLRPDNYPPGQPGKGYCLYSNSKGHKLGVINLMGRTFMDPLDCPFRRASELVEKLQSQTKCIFVDFHAEASSEKMAMGWHLNGKASVVIGTHTHVQTADERILDGGTAYMTDSGMTGPYDSIIGVKKEIILNRFIFKRGARFEPATSEPWFCGAVIEVDDSTGHAVSIERLRYEGLDASV
jgi:2',3'-cyclic-nucleotide 2'-phosphodiesterase